jgi:hypothetical protein
MTLDQALEAAGIVEGWPVVVEPQLDPDSTYTISVRAGVRRGRMSDALRALIFCRTAGTAAASGTRGHCPVALARLQHHSAGCAGRYCRADPAGPQRREFLAVQPLAALIAAGQHRRRDRAGGAADAQDLAAGARLSQPRAGIATTARTVSIFGALVIVPLLLVYMFSLEFLNRGIDSWFRVEVKRGLGDALVLSRSALDLRMREQGRRAESSPPWPTCRKAACFLRWTTSGA